MPTLECLDERSRAILARLDEMDEKFSAAHIQFRTALEARDKALMETLKDHDRRISEIELNQAVERGQRSVAAWLGGMVLVVLGAIGNMVLVWLVGPNGPLHLSK